MTFPSHKPINSPTKSILNNKPGLHNYNDCNNTTTSLIDSSQHNIMHQQQTTTNPNSQVIHYRDGIAVLQSAVLQSADLQFSRQNKSHLATQKSSDQFSLQNNSHITTTEVLQSSDQFSRLNSGLMSTFQSADQRSRLNGGHMSLDSNTNLSIQDFDPATDLSSFLKHVSTYI